MTTRARTIAAIALAAIGMLAALAVARTWPSERQDIPTARVTRGALKLDVHATGEVRAGRSVTLSAPPVGGTLRLVTLAETGSAVRAGDVVMEFDRAEQLFALEQSRSELHEAEQEIVKMRADLEVQAAQDAVELLTARFDVRRAELDASSGEELIGAIEAQKRKLMLDEARRRLAQLEEDVPSRASTSRASLAVAEEKRTKARLAAERAQHAIDSMVVRSPMDGLVVAKDNRDALGGFFFSGMVLPEYRPGDLVFPGRPVLDVFEAGGLEVRAKVSEQERASVEKGQMAQVRADGLPGVPLVARVADLSGLAGRTPFFDRSGPVRTFDATLRLEEVDPRLRPGTTVQVVVTGNEVADALLLPRQALFEKDGKTVVYVRQADRFEPREVKVTHRTAARVAIEGLAEGAEVALVNPDATPQAPATQGPAIAAVGAGR